jgi:hypothetical protein
VWGVAAVLLEEVDWVRVAQSHNVTNGLVDEVGGSPESALIDVDVDDVFELETKPELDPVPLCVDGDPVAIVIEVEDENLLPRADVKVGAVVVSDSVLVVTSIEVWGPVHEVKEFEFCCAFHGAITLVLGEGAGVALWGEAVATATIETGCGGLFGIQEEAVSLLNMSNTFADETG